jgi:small-conductance mechanosensitive channel
MHDEALQDAEEIEKIKQDPQIQRALDQCNASRRTKPNSGKGVRSLIVVTGAILMVCTALYFVFEWRQVRADSRYVPYLKKLLLLTIVITIVILLATLAKRILKASIENATARYNASRIADLIAAILIFFSLLSLLFANWYATMVSFGIISLVLGLALQNPITSFFAWIYILIRKPYSVGDRIRIGSVKGDVIELGYLDTTLWEFGGEYLSGDHPSGRIISFSNSRVFSEYIYNYSWPLFPFIWNEIKLFVAYESDLSFVTETVRAFVEKEVGEAMIRRVRRYKNILNETPIDQLDVREYPSIILRANENTWVEVVVRYLVEPKISGQVKNRIFKNLLEELRSHPDKVLFPKTNMR